MARAWAVVKREFNAMVRTKAFLLGTLLGPLAIVAVFGLQFLFMRGGGGERSVAVADASAEALGEQVALTLGVPVRAGGEGLRFRTELVPARGRSLEEVRHELAPRVATGELDGYLYLPPGTTAGDRVHYEGRNAAALGDIQAIEGSVQRAVQQRRLVDAGIDPARVDAALARVPFDARRTGERGGTGAAGPLLVLAYLMGFISYLVVILYGNAVMRGVLEEKRDRIVEIIVSSINARRLMLGKVVGIGAAGLLQVAIWIGFAALLLTFGDTITAALGLPPVTMPAIPAAVGITFLAFFAAGYFLYASLYAMMGAIATSDQEAQQLQFPIIMLMIIAISMMGAIITDPNGTPATVGSLVPFTSPIVMPMRAVLTEVPLAEALGGLALLVLTGLVAVWFGGKIYRIGILSTGKKPSMRELARWLRTA
jgi:ABC-2 type transport system permease protein